MASVDAISAHNVDALSNGTVHNLAADMNPGGHAKLIRLDRNQQRENRFWRKQRVREKKQRKWEEQVRKQREDEQDAGVADRDDDEAISDNDPADEREEDEDTADDVDSENAAEDIRSAAPDDDNAADVEDELGDSGYKAEEEEEDGPQRSVHPSDEDPALVSEEGHRDSDEDGAAHEDDGNHSLDDEARDSSGVRIEQTGSYRENDEYSSGRERSESAIEPGGNNDESNELGGTEITRETGTEDHQEDRNFKNDSEEDDHSTNGSNNDNHFNGSIAADNEDAEARPESNHPEDDNESYPDADAAEQAPERTYGDGYETDDERERTRDDRADEERDSAVGGSSEDQRLDSAVGGSSEDPRLDSAATADRPASDWVGPRSVSPYIEQQLADAADGDGVPTTQQQQQEEAADSAVERDSVFSADEEAVPESAGTRPDSEARSRPPSRVSLVYTYASGPKVLSHVELAPETEAERRPASGKPQETTEAEEGADDKNGKRVTFKEDEGAASSVRIRRRRSETAENEQDEGKQWKEIRKKNKERRKNRTSNTFRYMHVKLVLF